MKQTKICIKLFQTALALGLLCSCDINEHDSMIAEINELLMNLAYDELSDYEIYCKNYIYIKSEAEWLADSENGTLDYLDNSVLDEKYTFVLQRYDDFDDHTILVGIDKYFHDKTFAVEDFHMVELSNVRCLLGPLEEGEIISQIYALTLKTPSKENVIRSIRKLEIFAFTNYAEPNIFAYPLA